MARYERAVVETIGHPDHVEDDERPGRQRFFARGRGPSSWLRVIVDFSSEEAEVVTAFGQKSKP